jgi:transcriptional regulator with XRE-family HTH domain
MEHDIDPKARADDLLCEVGERLAQALALRGMTYSQLADELGTYRSRVSAWVNAKEPPGGRYLVLLPEVLGINAHWLLTGEGSPEPDGEAADQVLGEILSCLRRARLIQ